MKRTLLLFLISACGAIVVVALVVARSPLLSFSDVSGLLAGAFFTESTTPEAIRGTYTRALSGGEKVRVLIVPGHDDESWGTEFRGVREADMTALLGEELTRFLSADSAFRPILVRSRKGYALGFEEYIEKEWRSISAFIDERKQTMSELVLKGAVQTKTGVVHNKASSHAAAKLYAINKWANEHKVDVILHLHFNDYPGRRVSRPGRYEGFTLYVPEAQFSNARASRAIAASLLEQFSVFYVPSNLPVEDGGIVEDQKLIAVGSHNTLDGASVLIEYGYIYEQRFLDSEVRAAATKELAFQTYQGLNRFFGKGREPFQKYDTMLLPHTWGKPLREGVAGSLDVFSLQAALMREGLYPPAGKSKRECPLSGGFGPCTQASVKSFQEKYGLPVSGVVGAETLLKLNEKFSR